MTNNLPSPTDPNTPSEPKGRIGKRVEKALRAIVFDGMTQREAADFAGLSLRGVEAALTRPHVRAFRRDLEQAARSGLFVKSLKVAVDLMNDAKSESVRLQAAQWIHEKTDPEAHRSGSDTSKTLIIRIDPGAADRLTIDQSAGTVKAQQYQDVTDIVSE